MLSTPIGTRIGICVRRDERPFEGFPGRRRGDTPAMPSYYRNPLAPTPNQPLLVGAAALIERDDALLLDRRADDGTWGLIAGALEPDESISDAVRREVKEETGLDTSSIELFGVFSDPSRIVGYDDGNVYRVLSIVFRVGVVDGEPMRSEESHELRFVPFDELPQLDVTPAHRPIIERFLTRPNGVVVE
jgi:ADP-ribose pyrophosphatase YjhB (NUDIX family)